MAQKRIDLKIALDNADAASSLKELRQSFKDLRDIQLQFGEGTKEFDIAAQKAGQLKDRIDAANDSIRNLSASPIENLRNSSSRLVQQIKSLDFGGATQSLRDLGSSGKALLGIEKGAKLGTIAFRGLGAAIAATGIGAFVAIIAIVIDQFDEIKKSGGALGNIFNFIGETVEFVQNKLIDFLNYFKLVNGAALKAGIAQEKANKQAEESLNKLNLAYGLNADKYSESTQKKFQADLEYRDNVLKINKDETLSAQEKEKLIADAAAQRNRKILAVDEERRKANKEAEEKAAEKQKEDNKKVAEEAIKQKQLQKDTETKILQDKENERSLFADLNIRQIQDENTKELEILDEKYEKEKFQFRNNKTALIELEKIYQTERNLLLDQQAERELQKQRELNDKKEQEEIAYEDFLIANSEKYNLTNNEIDTLLEEERQRRRDENLSLDESAVLGSVQRVLEIRSKQKEEETKLDTEATEARKQRVDDVLTAVSTTLTVAGNAVTAIQSLFQSSDEELKKKTVAQQKKEFERNKKFQIALALINTAQSAISAFASVAQTPFVGPILAPIAAAAAIVAGIAQVKKIKAQKFEAPSDSGAGSKPSSTPTLGGGGSLPSLPGGGGASSVSPSPAAIAPQFFGTSGAFSGNKPQPVRAFVVESELTDAQLRAELLRRRTRL